MPNTHGPSPMETTPKPRAGEHTKGPWRVALTSDDKGTRWTVMSDDGSMLPNWEANARRIVACVNYCEGVPTELLETHPGDIKTVSALALRNGEQADALEAERDLLRERERGLAVALDEAIRFIVRTAAHKGNMDATTLAKEETLIMDHTSQLSSGRWAGDMVSFDLAAARALLAKHGR